MFKTCCSILVLVALFVAPAVAQERDVSFVAAIKGSRYDQPHDGKPELTRYFFFTEIFLASGGNASDASLRRVGSEDPPWRFDAQGDVLAFAGGYFSSLEELDAAFPEGRYQLDLDSPSGALSAQPLEFAAIQGQRLPRPVTISLLQDGIGVAPNDVDPVEELSVTWSEYEQGRADPNAIVDDLIFVILTDCHGKIVSHSGRPFAGTPFLTYAIDSYAVPKGSLAPGLPYTLVVEHASVVNSDQSQGVPVFASYATVTYLEFRTSGEATNDTCPAPEEK